MRYFIEFAYDGSKYHGWQRQLNAISVQGFMEDALNVILQSKITINGSSRTDTGVHAAQQFAHFDSDEIDREKVKYKMNGWLPDDIAILAIYKMNNDSHSRFDATARKYIYRLNQSKNPFLRSNSLYYPKELNFEAMNECAKLLISHLNFQCFSKVKTEVNNFNCNIMEAIWLKKENHWEFHIQANRFLRGMVRAIVGTLLDVGLGKMNIVEFQMILDSKDRSKAGVNVKAHGLTLVNVLYPKNYFDVNN